MRGVGDRDAGPSTKGRVAHVVPTDRIAYLLLRRRLHRLTLSGYEVHLLCGHAPDSLQGPAEPNAGASKGSVSTDRTFDYASLFRDLGVTLRHLPFAREISPWTDARCAAALFSAVRDGGYDVVHSHNPKGGLLGPPVAQVARAPHVLHTVHGFLFHDRIGGLHRAAAVAAERWTARWTDHLLFQSEEDLEHARTHGYKAPDRLHLVGNGVDETYFNPESAPEAARRQRATLGWNDEHLVVGTVGRFVSEKGYHEFFEMAGRLAAAHDHVRFLAVGIFEPEQSDAVNPAALARQHGVEDRCAILQGRDDMPTLYAAMDVFVLASHREGLSRSLLEAMALARPVVTCNIRGCREVVVDGKSGVLTPVKDSEGLTAVVKRLVADGEARAQLGAAARARVLERYTEGVVASRVASLYDAILEPRRL